MSSSSSRSGAEITVRRIGEADFPEVSRLAAGVREDDNAYPIDNLDRELRGVSDREISPERVAFGAFEGDRLVGTACGAPIGEGAGYVSRVYVAPEKRGSGVARAVTRHVEDYLRRSLGCTRAMLHFWGPRHGTQRVWIRLGYSRAGTRGVHHEDVSGFVVGCLKLL